MLEKLNRAPALMCDFLAKLRPGSVKVTDLFLHHMKGSITFNSNQNGVDRRGTPIKNALWLRLIMWPVFKKVTTACHAESVCGQGHISLPALSLLWDIFQDPSCLSFPISAMLWKLMGSHLRLKISPGYQHSRLLIVKAWSGRVWASTS